MSNERLSSLISHGAIQPKHVDQMISHVNSWNNNDLENEEKHGKTDEIMRGLRSISGTSQNPEVLGRFHTLNTGENFSFPSKLNKIRSNLAENKHTPSHVLFDIAQKEPRFIGSVSANPNLSPDHAHEIAQDVNIARTQDIHYLASRPDLNDETKDVLLSKAESPRGVNHSGYLLSRLANNPNLSAEHQNRIYNHATHLTKTTSFSGYDALGHLAAHPKLDHDLARKMAKEHGGDDETMAILKANKHLPPGVTE
jgi:hypothetical protein